MRATEATFSRYVAYLTAELLTCRPKLQPRPKPLQYTFPGAQLTVWKLFGHCERIT